MQPRVSLANPDTQLQIRRPDGVLLVMRDIVREVLERRSEDALYQRYLTTMRLQGFGAYSQREWLRHSGDMHDHYERRVSTRNRWIALCNEGITVGSKVHRTGSQDIWVVTKISPKALPTIKNQTTGAELDRPGSIYLAAA